MALSATVKRALLALVALAAAALLVDATQVMHRPSTYKDAPRKVSTTKHAETKIVNRRTSTGMVQAAYFTNWSVGVAS